MSDFSSLGSLVDEIREATPTRSQNKQDAGQSGRALGGAARPAWPTQVLAAGADVRRR